MLNTSWVNEQHIFFLNSWRFVPVHCIFWVKFFIFVSDKMTSTLFSVVIRFGILFLMENRNNPILISARRKQMDKNVSNNEKKLESHRCICINSKKKMLFRLRQKYFHSIYHSSFVSILINTKMLLIIENRNAINRTNCVTFRNNIEWNPEYLVHH